MFSVGAAVVLAISMSGDARSVYRKTQGAVVTIIAGSSAGTGFSIGDGRIIVTCDHVIRNAPNAILIRGAGPQGARVLVRDPKADVAVLSVAKPIRPALHFSTRTPEQGTPIYVIGNPLGMLEKTLSEGIVSGIRKVDTRTFIQITAAVSHGSSGSPVVNSDGSVIGMAAIGLSEGQSLNFAVAASTLDKLSRQRNRVSVTKAGPSPTGVQAKALKYIKGIRNRATATEEAYVALAKLGTKTLPVLFEALRKPDKNGQPDLLLSGAIPYYGAAAKASIVKALGSKERFLRLAVADAVNTMAFELLDPPKYQSTAKEIEESQASPLRSAYAFVRDPEVVAALRKALLMDRGEAYVASALGYLNDQASIPSLIRIAKSTDSFRAFYGIHSLCYFREGVDAKELEQSVIHCLQEILDAAKDIEEEDSEEPEKSINDFLAPMAESGSSVGGELLRGLLDHPSPVVRLASVMHLLKRNEPNLVDQIEALLGDEDSTVRGGVALVLGHKGGGKYIDKLLIFLVSSEVQEKRGALLGLALAKSDRGVEKSLLLVKDEEVKVRDSLVLYLEAIGNDACIGGLRILTRDPSPEIRKKSKESLARLEARKKEAVPQVVPPSLAASVR